MTNLAAEHRTYRLTEVYTSDPVNVEFILKTQFHNYAKGDHNYNILSGLLGDGIFAVDGDKWRQQRKISSYEFSTKVLRNFSTVVFRCGSNEEGTKFSKAFDDASSLTLWRYVDPFWKVKKLFNIGSEAALNKTVKIVDDFVYKLINNKIELMRTVSSTDDLKKDVNETQQDPTYLRDIILNFVIAGKDTTAATLSWFVYMMCKHPDVQDKVCEEIMEATERKEFDGFREFAESISEEALEKMQYLHAAITETLRLYPAVPVDAKVCVSDDTLPDGYNVKKGDMVAYQPYAMGRMKFIWGDDCEQYKPERWLNQDGIFQPQSPFKFTAFQAGPRICLGKEFAYRQMKIFAAVLIRSFVFKLSDETKDVSYRTMLTLHVDGGLHVAAAHRSSC
ncbi:Cytochrome P450 704C1 [Linum grandiflorum]